MSKYNRKEWFGLLSIVLAIILVIPLSLIFGEGDNNRSGIAIQNIKNECVSGAELVNGKYVWNAESNTDQHSFNFKVIYSTSGKGYINPGELVITIPLHIIKDREGNTSDEALMSLWTKEEYEREVALGQKPRGVDLVYSIVGDGQDQFIKVENVSELPAATEGYFEVGYYTAKHAIEYKDMDPSEAFNSKISLMNKEKTGNPISVYMNTSATIEAAKVWQPELYSKWDKNWGKKPADIGDDYYFIKWETYGYINKFVNQKYDYSCDFDVSSPEGHPKVIKYTLNGEWHESGAEKNCTRGEKIYDTVITGIKKSEYKNLTKYSVKLKIKDIVTPVDKVDESTSASAEKTFYWTKPEFEIPKGSFMIHKWGNESYGKETEEGKYQYGGDYARYDLQNMQNDPSNPGEKVSSLNGIKYHIMMHGFPFKWTCEKGKGTKYTDYGKKKVKWVLTDDTVFPVDPKNPKFENEYYRGDEGVTPLKSEDYDFEYVDFNVMMRDAKRENGELILENADYVLEDHKFTDDDILHFDIKTNGKWIRNAAEFNLENKRGAINNKQFISKLEDGKIVFNDGVDGYKIWFDNKYYYSRVDAYPSIKIYDTDTVKDWIGQGAKDAKEYVILKNMAYMKTFDYEGTELCDIRKIIGDRLRRTQKESKIEKNVVGTFNDIRNKQYEIKWNVEMMEFFATGPNTKEAVEQKSGTFYDLLPYGCFYKDGSVVVADRGKILSENQIDVKVIENFRDSGQDMLIVKVDETVKNYDVYYTTVHPWDFLSDSGRSVYNPVAYETGNKNIANGYKDNGGQLQGKGKEYMEKLDPNCKDKRFIYSSNNHWISALTSSISGLDKLVKAKKDNNYSVSTTVSANGTYKYKLRFKNSNINKSKNIVLYDSLENYYKTEAAEKGKSQWYGTLQSIDLGQLKQKGIDASIYISTKEGICLDDKESIKLNDTSIWKKVSEGDDLSKAKAVAIDCTKAKDGGAFILDKGETIFAVLNMRAPSNVKVEEEGYMPETYNNVYLKDTVIDDYEGEKDFFIHQDYTTVKYKAVLPEFRIHKVSEFGQSNIKNISFRLFGTSDYGTDVDLIKTTDRKGIIVFKDLEKGHYKLQEYDAGNDWILDTTVHNIEVTSSGKLIIDGEESNDLLLTLKNKKRVHVDTRFRKVDSKVDNKYLAGVEFRLKGVSDYGNQFLKIVKSNEQGYVEFTGLEKGSYSLVETKTISGYIKDKTEYTLTVNADGTVSISYLDKDGKKKLVDQDKWGFNLIKNQPLHKLNFFKLSSFDDKPIYGAEFNLKGTAENGTEYDETVTSSKRGFVEFTNLNSGIYVLTENKAADGYVKWNGKLICEVKSDGSFTIEGLKEDYTFDGENYYKLYNNLEKNDKIYVKKKWITDEKIPDINDINISIGTSVESMKNNCIVWTFKYKDGPVICKEYLDFNFNRLDGKLDTSKFKSKTKWNGFNGYGNSMKQRTTEYLGRMEKVYQKQYPDKKVPVKYRKFYNFTYEYPEMPKCKMDVNKLYKNLVKGHEDDIRHVVFTNLKEHPELSNNSKMIDKGDGSFGVYGKLSNGTLYIAAHGNQNVEVDKLVVKGTTSYNGVFKGLENLESVTGDNITINKNCTDLNNLFNGCKKLKNIESLKYWNVKNVKNMSKMFRNCNSLEDFSPLKNWNVRSVENTESMFILTNMRNASSFSNWKLERVTTTVLMFGNCSKLTDVSALENWKGSINKSAHMDYMFENSPCTPPSWYKK